MSNSLEIARSRLLGGAGLIERDIERTLSALLGPGVDYADLFFEQTRSESWSLEGGIVKEGSQRTEQGVGIRANAGEKTGFAHCDDLAPAALLEAARAARAIAAGGQGGELALRGRTPAPARYARIDPLGATPTADKLALLRRLDAHARALDERVVEVSASLTAVHSTVLVATSDGLLAADVRPLVRVNCSVIMESGGRRESGTGGGGGRHDLERLLADDAAAAMVFVEQAVHQARVAMAAQPAPAGTMAVVLGPGWPGILLHEAIGHGLEGDFNRKGTSAFSGRIGERIAAPGCTVVDDGTLADRRGSLSIDDEGTPAQCTTLIEDGILTGYMHDRLSARLSGAAPTGNGRRQSYAHRPMPRMTNTCMLAGPHDPAEIIASVDEGLYALNFGGGQVDITSGRFVFSANEAYLIRGGKVCEPVKGATLIGNGAQVLQAISMIGNDAALDSGVGTCGKDGQHVPVGVGQPSIRVDALTVGGTA